MGNDASTTNSSTATTQNDTASSATNPTVNNPNNTNAASTNVVANIPDEVNTAITEYLDIVKSEYEIERSKKDSFENRAGIIIALLSALFVFVIDKVLISDIISLFSVNLTFTILLRIFFGLGVYISLAYALVCAFITISTRKQKNFNVKSIDMALLAEVRMNALARLVLAYKEIIIQHRDLNEKRAKTYKHSLYGSVISIVSVVIYLSLR